MFGKAAHHNFVNVVSKVPNKYYSASLAKYKIKQYKSLFALKLEQYQYFNF